MRSGDAQARHHPVLRCPPLFHPALAGDTVVDRTMPEILVYVPGDDGVKPGAVEWFVADAGQDLDTDGDRPTLFDRLPFDGPMRRHEPGMPVHDDLHVWLDDHNPAGQLAPSTRR